MTPGQPAPGDVGPRPSDARPALSPLQERALRTSISKDIFQIVAFTAAGIWALATFWYQSSWVPAHARPQMDMALTIERLGLRGNEVMLRGRLVVHNVGKAPQQILATSHNVWGVRVASTADAGAPLGPPSDAGWGNRMQGFTTSEPELLAVELSPLLVGRSIIGAGEQYTYDYVFYVDRTRADQVTLQSSVYVNEEPGGTAKAEWFARKWFPTVGWQLVASEDCVKSGDKKCVFWDDTANTTVSLWDLDGAKVSGR